MNKEEIEKALKLFNRQDLIDNATEDLDTNIEIFMTVNQMIHYSKLQRENKQLKDNWNKIKNCIIDIFNRTQEIYYLDLLTTMQELEKGSEE